jgi:hypothetical protein
MAGSVTRVRCKAIVQRHARSLVLPTAAEEAPPATAEVDTAAVAAAEVDTAAVAAAEVDTAAVAAAVEASMVVAAGAPMAAGEDRKPVVKTSSLEET